MPRGGLSLKFMHLEKEGGNLDLESQWLEGEGINGEGRSN